MPARHLFEYAIVRVVPRVEREEFLNVGIVLYCREAGFLRVAYELNESRLRALNGDVNLREIEEQLRTFERVCAGGAEAGPLGGLPAGERFRWLTAPRSTVVQTSPVHTGFSDDPGKTILHLISTLVK